MGNRVYNALRIAQETTMKTISLTGASNDWRAIARDVEASGSPVALTIDDTICGILLPSSEAGHVVKHFSVQELR